MVEERMAEQVDARLDETDFEAIHLKTGEVLLMQFKEGSDTSQYRVTYIGALEGHSFLATLPTAQQKGLWLKVGTLLNFKALHGRFAYAFVTKVMRARSRPYPYAHFAIPAKIRFRQIRASSRLPTVLPVEVKRANGTRSLAIMRDVSRYGARLELVGHLDEIGAVIELAMPIILPDSTAKITVAATIRNCGDIERSLAAGRFHYGVELAAASPEEDVLFQRFVDHLVVEQLNLR
jgi:hypothetical protein